MGCNVEKAKLEIYEILVKDQKKSDKKTVENIEKLAEDIASKLDSDIKSNFIMSNNKNAKNEKVKSKEEPKVQPQKVKSSKLTFGQTILEKVKKFFEEVE